MTFDNTAGDLQDRAAEPEAPLRGLGKRAVGPNRRIHVASALALTEPGPAAAGIVVLDERGRVVASRASYVGRARRDEALGHALLLAIRLAYASGLESPAFVIDHSALADAMGGSGTWPEALAPLRPALEQAASQLGRHTIEVVPTSANQARSVALAPLVEWLPERTRRAEELNVTPLGDGLFDVQSESTPDQTYRVTFRLPSEDGSLEGETLSCECADFVYRELPCKHLLAVARHLGATERLFVGAEST